MRDIESPLSVGYADTSPLTRGEVKLKNRGFNLAPPGRGVGAADGEGAAL